MIRFLPDDWVDVLMRPIDMVAPEANVYVEIAAPEVRLAAALIAAAVLLVLWKWRTAPSRPALSLLALLIASMVPWLATTGNGRYFIAWLVLLGPLCIGLLRPLPVSTGKKLALGGSLILAQMFVLSENPPWRSWTWVNWTDAPYFKIDPPPAEPATYVTIANISYSLIAPQFPAAANWINLSGGVSPRDAPDVARRLSHARSLNMLVPAIPSEVVSGGQPSAAAADALGRLLQGQRLFLKQDASCTFLRSEGLARIGLRLGTQPAEERADRYGFWICPIEYRPDTQPSGPGERDVAVESVFETVERLCPRFFPPGAEAQRINGAWLKQYDTDTKVYLLDDGTAMYKFWRSVNPVLIGTRADVLAGRASIDCTKIRAPNWRRGGP
jgi:hypothetical protein